MAFIPSNNSRVSTGNTTTTPLGIGVSFVGAWEACESIAEIKISFSSDVGDGAQFFVDFSLDGIVVESSLPIPPDANASQISFGGLHTLNPTKPFFRCRYVNGSTAQGSFSLTTYISGVYGGGLISRASQILGKQSDVELVRVANDIRLDKSRGLYNYLSPGRKFGQNSAVGVGAYEALWENGGTYVYPQAAEPFRVRAGGDVNDTAAGTGAREITIIYLDENWNEVTETLALAGASASANTASNGIRLLRAYVSSVGTYHGTNIGTIVIENATTNLTLGAISAGIGQTQLGLTSVPDGHVMYISRIFVAVGQGNTASVRLILAENGDDVTVPFANAERQIWGIQDFSGGSSLAQESYIEIPGRSDIRFEAIRITGGGTALVSVDFDFELVRDL